MGDRGLHWGIGLGILAALAILLMPQARLEAMLVGSGVSAVLPAAAPPLGMLTRTMLAIAAFAIILAIGALLGNRRGDRTEEDDLADGVTQRPDATPIALVRAPSIAPAGADGVHASIARIEAQLAALTAQIQAVAPSGNADLGKTLRSVQALLRNPPSDPALLEAIRSIQPAHDTSEAVLARIEALEQRIVERIGDVEGRIAAVEPAAAQVAPHGNILPLPRLPVRRPTGAAAQRISRTLADIRRSIDEPGA